VGWSSTAVTAVQGQKEGTDAYEKSPSHKVIIADSAYGGARCSVEQANRVGYCPGA
jgi:hypothetical protein